MYICSGELSAVRLRSAQRTRKEKLSEAASCIQILKMWFSSDIHSACHLQFLQCISDGYWSLFEMELPFFIKDKHTKSDF